MNPSSPNYIASEAAPQAAGAEISPHLMHEVAPPAAARLGQVSAATEHTLRVGSHLLPRDEWFRMEDATEVNDVAPSIVPPSAEVLQAMYDQPAADQAARHIGMTATQVEGQDVLIDRGLAYAQWDGSTAPVPEPEQPQYETELDRQLARDRAEAWSMMPQQQPEVPTLAVQDLAEATPAGPQLTAQDRYALSVIEDTDTYDRQAHIAEAERNLAEIQGAQPAALGNRNEYDLTA